MRVPWFRVSLVLALVGAAPPANAQMFSTLTQDLMQTRTLLKPVEDLAGRVRAQAGASATPPAAPDRTHAGRTALVQAPVRQTVTTFNASPEVRRRVRGQFVDWVKSNAPAMPAAEEARLRQADFVAEWTNAVREDGLKPGDTADALAAYWLLNWMMANGRQSNTAAEAQAVRDQTRRLLQANSGFAALRDAHKQELAEVWMMNFLLQGNAYFDAIKRGDKVLSAKLGEAAAMRFRNEMGVELTRLRLTPTGFDAS